MKHLSIVILTFISMVCHAQDNQQDLSEPKTYTIGAVSWYYELPKEYLIRQDQFSEARAKGSEQIEKNGARATKDDVILVSAAKNSNSNRNMLIVSYRNNEMIREFGLEGYRNKVVDFLQSTFENYGAVYETEAGEVRIDSMQFYTIENKIFTKDSTYLYSKMMFIGEISEKEVSCTLAFDNETDKDLLIRSLLNSKFKEL